MLINNGSHDKQNDLYNDPIEFIIMNKLEILIKNLKIAVYFRISVYIFGMISSSLPQRQVRI